MSAPVIRVISCMLAALKEAERELAIAKGDRQNEYERSAAKALEKVRAAIAKAEGRE